MIIKKYVRVHKKPLYFLYKYIIILIKVFVKYIFSIFIIRLCYDKTFMQDDLYYYNGQRKVT